jgi:hypothetical protein
VDDPTEHRHVDSSPIFSHRVIVSRGICNISTSSAPRSIMSMVEATATGAPGLGSAVRILALSAPCAMTENAFGGATKRG